MIKFDCHTGIAAPLLQDNIDTDQIIPSREMKTVSKQGLAAGLFSGQRYLYSGEQKTGENPEFVLNQKNYSAASILVSGKNFGCGSSREHAVWAILEYGIRAVVAESYGEIFFNNALRNGLLPIVLEAKQIQSLLLATDATPLNPITIDLEERTISVADKTSLAFAISDYNQQLLLNGWDAIDLALQFDDRLTLFTAQDRNLRPWAYLD